VSDRQDQIDVKEARERLLRDWNNGQPTMEHMVVPHLSVSKVTHEERTVRALRAVIEHEKQVQMEAAIRIVEAYRLIKQIERP
jgi:hypothetical protein